MMCMNRLLNFLLLISFLASACNAWEVENLPELQEAGLAEYYLEEKSKVIELDQYSGAQHAIKGITDQNEYYFFNTFNQSIYLYDLKQKPQKPKKIIKVPLDEAVHFYEVSELYYHNADSIFIYDQNNELSNRAELFIINSDGVLINSFKIFGENEGFPVKSDSDHTTNGKSMIYHDGKLLFLSKIIRGTTKENWKPLILFDLNHHSLSLHGVLPKSQEENYGRIRWWSNFCLIPELNKVVVSFPYEPNLFFFDVNTLEWQEFRFRSDLVTKPSILDDLSISSLQYLLSNSWYFSLEYDQANKVLWRTAQLAHVNESQESNASVNLSGQPQNYEYINFLINPFKEEYHITSGIGLLELRFFHPAEGPFIRVQKQEELGLSPEDYLVFRPLKLSFKEIE